jgi:uncharacterized membrane protein
MRTLRNFRGLAGWLQFAISVIVFMAGLAVADLAGAPSWLGFVAGSVVLLLWEAAGDRSARDEH